MGVEAGGAFEGADGNQMVAWRAICVADELAQIGTIAAVSVL